MKLRELATKDLIGNWMTRKRAARISRAGEIGVNPDQRIQADAQTLTELTTDLGIGLIQSSVLLVSFIGVLWILSSGVVMPMGGRYIEIPGYMVWAALIYAGTGSCDLLAHRPAAGASRRRALRPRGRVPLRRWCRDPSAPRASRSATARPTTRRGAAGGPRHVIRILRQLAFAGRG